MTEVRTGSNWNTYLGLLMACLACSNDRFVVVGRLHTKSPDASMAEELADASVDDTVTTESSLTPSSSGSLATSAPVASTNSTLTDTPQPVDSGCFTPDLAHRYSFAGTGLMLPDLAGQASGELRAGATLTDEGILTLDGDDDFVALPANLLSGLTSVSVMLWVRYSGGPAYVRLFDFGTSSAGFDPPEGEPSVGRSYLALTPATGNDPSGLAALAATDGAGSEVLASSDATLGDDEWHQVTVVLDGNERELRLYLDAGLMVTSDVEHTAAEIDNENNWLGRSQYDADPYIEISYDEVRIYNDALAPCAIATAFANGPDVP